MPEIVVPAFSPERRIPQITFAYSRVQREMNVIEVLILNLFTGNSHMHQLAARVLQRVPSSSVASVQNVAKNQFCSFNFRLLPEDSQIIVLQAVTFLLSHNLLLPDKRAICNLLLFIFGESHPLLSNADLPSDPYRSFLFFG